MLHDKWPRQGKIGTLSVRRLRITLTMIRIFHSFLLSLMLVTFSPVFAAAAPSHAVTTALGPNKPTHSTKKDTGGRLWQLQGADIRSVIDEVSHITGKNFVIDPRVQGRVTIVSGKKLHQNEVYPVFLSLLRVLGFSAVPAGAVTKIVPNIDARQMAAPLLAGHHVPGDAPVVSVIPLKFLSAQQLVPTLRPLLPDAASLTVYAPANMLVVAGSAANVRRVSQIVKKVDSRDNNGIDMINLKHAIATNVVKTLKALQGANPYNQAGKVTLAADDASNSILMSGNLQQRIRLRVLIAKLDAGLGNQSQGNTQVIYLHYLHAKDLVPVLAGIAKASYGTSKVGTVVPAVPQDSLGHDKQPSAPLVTSQTSSASVKLTNGTGGNQVEIVAEPHTNAIIITAPPTLLHTLREVVAKLDIRPAQVLVQAAIVEISESKLRQLGIQWGTRSGGGDGTPFSTLTGGLGIGFIKAGNFRALIQALGNDSSSDILSTPSLVVLDNEKAKIKVGKMVPFTTGSYATNSGDAITNPYTTQDRKYIGLNLNVTPQINQGNAVLLKIDQGNETLLDNTSTGNVNSQLNPTTSKSSIDTTVLVNNQEILVLGGLIKDVDQHVTDKFPILGDIPGLGQLFQSHRDDKEKMDLMVFLMPVILHNADNGLQVTGGKYNFMRDQQLVQHSRFGTGAILAPWGTRHQVNLPSPFSP